MYVETDFLLALAKDNDWLQSEAEAVLAERNVETSLAAFVELLMLGERYDYDRTRAVANLLELVELVPDRDRQVVLKAAGYQDEYDMTTFDAVHAAIAETQGRPICSSDRAYDDLDLERVPLEPDGGA